MEPVVRLGNPLLGVKRSIRPSKSIPNCGIFFPKGPTSSGHLRHRPVGRLSMIVTSTILFVVLIAVEAELPTELDPFLEVLFDVKECDSFLTGDFTSVATIECPPYRCDFPRQVCMRLNSRYQEVNANECRLVPIECLTAANGGIPVGPQLIIQPPSPALTVDKSWKERGVFNGFSEKNIVHPMMINPTDICQMGPPNGRFCGFKVMYTYNKETFQCDEFWFPGCTTVETNANLFSDMRSCQKLAEMCKSMPSSLLLPPSSSALSSTSTHSPFTPFPPSAHTLPPPVPSTIGMGVFGRGTNPNRVIEHIEGRGGMRGRVSGGGEERPFGTISPFGFGSALGGPSPSVRPNEGDGEDLGIFGLIQQSIQNAQAIKQGGPQGKQAAAAAAGQILQQFTGFDLNNLGGNFGNLFGR